MAKKVLGQSCPAATTVTTLYTVPSAKEAVVSSISVANLAATSATFRIIVQPSADVSTTILDKQYFGKDITVGASDTTIITVGITLATGDVIKIYASTATVAFQAFGDEASV
jgi:glucose-6-phosphate dehydrogenase assembly protein OpcA